MVEMGQEVRPLWPALDCAVQEHLEKNVYKVRLSIIIETYICRNN